VARRRAKTLAELSRQKRLMFAEQWIGSAVSVLFEEGETEGLCLGTTPHFLKVGVAREPALSSQIREVRITGASDRWAVGRLISKDMEGTLS
jgi:tRNA A37 methylthiotransferase MiaB